VAALAFRGFVLALQGVFGVFVVIERRRFPVRLAVAGLAPRAEYAFVIVVFLVAGLAIRRSIPILDRGLVAGLAVCFLGIGVRAVEGEICARMIEGRFIDRSDELLPSFVVGVAALTVRLRQSAMKPLPAFDVVSDIFVTVLTEPRLRRFIEAFVALCAVFFPFRMALDDLARHQRRFKTVGPCSPHVPETDEGDTEDKLKKGNERPT
jgi:hypothetical protein